MDPAMLALIGAGITSGSQAAGRWWQNRRNEELAREQMQWNKQMYGEMLIQNRIDWRNQNAWNEKMWHEANEYNSPQAQMARFAAAGLNPHLIYGKGTHGNANPLTTQRPNSPDIKGYDRAEAQSITQGMDTFGDFVRFKNIQAQTDNVKAQTDVANQQAILKGQDVLLRSLQVKREGVKANIDAKTMNAQISMADQNLKILQQNAKKLAAEATVAERTVNPRIRAIEAQAKEALLKLDGQELTNRLRQLEIELNEHGVQKGDNLFFRLMMQPENSKYIDKLIKAYKFSQNPYWTK
jgi:hypothetical protein